MVAYLTHHNRGRPHRGIALGVPDGTTSPSIPVSTLDVRRMDVLGGLIHEYHGAAA